MKARVNVQMERFFRLLMVTASQTDKGFTLLEMLIAIILIASLSMVSLRKYSFNQSEIHSNMIEYLLCQSEALCDRKDVYFDKGISFNSMGHVNQGRSLYFDRYRMIVHLGNGYVTYE